MGVVLWQQGFLLNDQSQGLDCRSYSRSGGLTSKKTFKRRRNARVDVTGCRRREGPARMHYSRLWTGAF